MTEGPVHLQSPLKAFRLDDAILREKYGLTVRTIDYDDKKDLETWCSIIHDSYDDCHFTIDSAKVYLTKHKFLMNTETFLFSDQDGEEFATVSIGLYKNKPHIGGGFRFGVRNSYQGKGYGYICLLYGFSKLASMGIKHAESIIAIKRVVSLNIHFALGFRPQYRSKYTATKSSSKTTRLPFSKSLRNLFVHYFYIPDLFRTVYLQSKLHKSYRHFLKRERESFL